MEITVEEVKKLAKLSRLEFTDSEAEKFVEEFRKTLEQVKALDRVDVSKVDLLETTLNADRDLRADNIGDSLSQDSILGNAPDKQDGSFLVPITVGEE